jgi:hypothetical protein
LRHGVTSTLDRWLPQYEFEERHRIAIRAAPEAVDRAVRSVTLGELPVARALFAVRSLPGWLSRRYRARANPHRPLIDEMRDGGFVMLEDVRATRLVLGLAGSLGRLTVPLAAGARTPEQFLAFDRVGAYKAVMDFCIDSTDGGDCVLSTETRVRALGADARRKFARYWFAIRPFSGLIRILFLRAARRRAEAYERAG